MSAPAPDASSPGMPGELDIEPLPEGAKEGDDAIGAGIGIDATYGGIGGGGIDAGTAIGPPNIGGGGMLGAAGAIDEGIGNGIEAGSGSGDDELWNEAPLGDAVGGASGAASGFSDAVVTSALRSRGSAVGLVEGLLAPGTTDVRGLGGMDAETWVRGATDGGAGGAIDGARGAIGGPLARGAIDAGLAADAGASADASDMRRVPGATLAGALTGPSAWLIVVLAGGASRPFVSSASASAMSGGSPCAVAASS